MYVKTEKCILLYSFIKLYKFRFQSVHYLKVLLVISRLNALYFLQYLVKALNLAMLLYSICCPCKLYLELYDDHTRKTITCKVHGSHLTQLARYIIYPVTWIVAQWQFVGGIICWIWNWFIASFLEITDWLYIKTQQFLAENNTKKTNTYTSDKNGWRF